jgi:hypothetical protein
MLTLIEKAYIRDLLTVPMSGVPTGGHVAGYRYLSRVGQLEFYMNNLGIEEESIITGRPIGLIVATGTPELSQVLTVGIDGQQILYTTQMSDLLATDPRGAVMAGLVNAINNSGNGCVAGRVNFQPPDAGQPLTTSPVFGQLLITRATAFTLTVSVSDNNGIALNVTNPGNTYPEPSLDLKQSDGTIKTLYGYIPVCLQLRKDILSARTTLALTSAGAKGDQGGAQFRPDQLFQRVQLFRYYVNMLGNALYAGPDPSGRLGSASGGRVRV